MTRWCSGDTKAGRLTDEQEVRAKALESADRHLAANAALGVGVPEPVFWQIVSAAEIYITTGVQPNGEKAT